MRSSNKYKLLQFNHVYEVEYQQYAYIFFVTITVKTSKYYKHPQNITFTVETSN